MTNHRYAWRYWWSHGSCLDVNSPGDQPLGKGEGLCHTEDKIPGRSSLIPAEYGVCSLALPLPPALNCRFDSTAACHPAPQPAAWPGCLSPAPCSPPHLPPQASLRRKVSLRMPRGFKGSGLAIEHFSCLRISTGKFSAVLRGTGPNLHRCTMSSTNFIPATEIFTHLPMPQHFIGVLIGRCGVSGGHTPAGFPCHFP